LRPVYDGTDGRDGFASMEISPHLAHDMPGTVDAARMLWRRLKQPNVLIKVPATAAGVSAIRTLIEEGINVNATLVFGRFRYQHVANAYVSGLKNRAARGLPISRIASVATFSLSCIDSVLDTQLEAMAAQGSVKAAGLIGRAAIAEAKLTYARSREIFDYKNAFAELANKDARPQALVWTSTTTENPGYLATRYIDPLVGPGTFTELSLVTMDAYRGRGHPDLQLASQLEDAALTVANLAALGLELCDIEMFLEAQELKKHRVSYDSLIRSIESKLAEADVSPPVSLEMPLSSVPAM
jgi:transaldolase